MIGEIVSHYRIVERLGAGGMGEVFRGEDLKLGRSVALKFLPTDLVSDQQAVKRFLWEARSLSALNHPNICTIYEVDEHHGRPFIAMELLEGQALHHYVGGKPLRAGTLIDLAAQIADGLGAAHVQGLLHRDVKPANIFVTQRGQAKILDFGLAKLTHDAHAHDVTLGSGGHVPREMTTSPGITMGTIAYMSPEQARGEPLDARSDLFSFGLVLYEMATGRQTFSGNTTAVIFDSILNRDPVPAGELNPDLPVELDRIISKAIEKDCRFRYQSASDLRADLERLKRALDLGRDVTTSGAMRAFKSGGVPAVTPLAAPVAPDDGKGRVRSDSRRKTGAAAAIPAPASRRSGARRPAGARGRLGLWIAAGLVVVAAGASGAYLIWQAMAGRGAAVEPVQVPADESVPPPAEGAPPAGLPPRTGDPATAGPPPAAAAGAPAQETAGPKPQRQQAGPMSAASARSAPGRATPGAAEASLAAENAARAKRATEEAEASGALADARAKTGAKEYEQALGVLTALLERKPGSAAAPEALLLIARIRELKGQPQLAIATYGEFRRRFAGDPQGADATLNLARLTLASGRRGRENETRGLLKDLAAGHPDTQLGAQSLLMKAELLDRLKDREVDPGLGASVPASLPSYRLLNERFPGDPVAEHALWRLGNMYDDLKRYELAAQAFDTLGTRFPDTRYDAWFRAGELYERRLKDIDKARAAYARVPPSSPRYRDAQRRVK